jgi:hypothetical protein
MSLLSVPPRSRLLAWSALVLALLAASAFLTNFDRVPEKQWIGYRGEARRNHLLALQRLLERRHIPVKSLTNLNELPPRDATLFLPTERLSLSVARSESLRRWVDQGGNLIVVTWTIKGEEGVDPLLDPLGIEQKLNEFDDGADWDKLFDPKQQVATAQVGAETMRIHFDPRYRLDPIPSGLLMKVESDLGVHAIRLALGQGTLTVLTDGEFAANDSIGLNDHAAFLWHLLAPAPERPVWLVRAEDMPPLWKLMWDHAPAVVMTLAALLVVFLWSRMYRFGPRLPAPGLARRQLGEHIVASGWYLWRNQRGGRMLEALRAVVFARAPELAAIARDAEDSIDSSGAVASVPMPLVRRALDATDVSSEQAFVDAVRTMETIRKQA